MNWDYCRVVVQVFKSHFNWLLICWDLVAIYVIFLHFVEYFCRNGIYFTDSHYHLLLVSIACLLQLIRAFFQLSIVFVLYS